MPRPDGVVMVWLGVLLSPAGALLVNNGVEGEPEVECGPTSLTVNVNTLNPFEGHVFVKGRHAEEGCRNSQHQTDRTAGIELSFDQCGVSRVRSLRPRGVFVEVTLIVSFHPLFVTKVDRAYKVQCFYVEADKTVEAEHELGISHLPVADVTQGVPMPVCRYEVLDGGPTGPPLLFAEVGQLVHHRWSCDSETIDTFCMVVRDCFVDDKQGARVDILDSSGCAVDRFLLGNLDYTSDLTAGTDAHVFKYADRPQLAFQCQISLMVKEPGLACPRPFCAQPAGRGAGSENLAEGPAPAAPDHPFPLGPNSPYRADADAPAFQPIPVPLDSHHSAPKIARSEVRHTAGSGYEQEPPARAPAVAGHLGQEGSGQSRPRNAAYEAERASRRAQLYNAYRSKRAAAAPAAAALAEAGTVDVRTELSALEVEERVEQLPPSALKQHPSPLRLGGKELCVSTVGVGVFLAAAAALLFLAIGAAAFALLRTPVKTAPGVPAMGIPVGKMIH